MRFCNGERAVNRAFFLCIRHGTLIVRLVVSLRFHNRATATTVVYISYTMLKSFSVNPIHSTSVLLQVKAVHISLVHILQGGFCQTRGYSETHLRTQSNIPRAGFQTHEYSKP